MTMKGVLKLMCNLEKVCMRDIMQRREKYQKEEEQNTNLNSQRTTWELTLLRMINTEIVLENFLMKFEE